jgi:ABC-type uncharacterized transport system permease subunit
MEIIIISVITLLAYLTAATLQTAYFFTPGSPRLSIAAWCFSLVGAVLHGHLLYGWIDTPIGQNLAGSNILSFVLWLVILFILFNALFQHILNLLVFVLPLTALSILLILLFPEFYLLDMKNQPIILCHVLLSLFTFSIVSVAAIQALFLTIQEHVLRHKQNGLIRLLPPLITMEQLLLQTISFAFVLLTLFIVCSLIFFDNIFGSGLLLTSLLTFASWLIFAGLICGHYFVGWRGKIITNGTAVGFSFLLLAYFGTKLLLLHS